MAEFQTKYQIFIGEIEFHREKRGWDLSKFYKASNVSGNVYRGLKDGTYPYSVRRETISKLISTLCLPLEEERRLFVLADLTPPMIPTSAGRRIDTMIEGVGLTLEQEQRLISDLFPGFFAHALKIKSDDKRS